MEPKTENERTLQLLRAVLPNPRWKDTAFLDWVYDHNPVGELIPQNVDVDGERVCHIGGVQILLRSGTDEGKFMILLNSSTAPSEQGKGTYVKTLAKLIARGRELGFHAEIGVTNAASTGPATRNALILGALPAKLCIPTVLRSPGYSSHPATAEYLASPEFEEIAKDLDTMPATDWTQRWSPELLRWRLAWPGGTYVVHVGPDLVGVSTKTSFKGVPFAVLLKVLPRHGRSGPIPSDQLIAAVCKHHRAPAMVYAGFNAHVPVKGFRLRQDRLPSPLNLMFQSTSDFIDIETFRFDTFEFLDFDAY